MVLSKTARLMIAISALSTPAFTMKLPPNDTLVLRDDRPPGARPDSLPGIAFTEKSGAEAALAAAPVWLFGRINKQETTCYPESAVKLGSNPPQKNPGTDVPASIDPGEDCTDPGDYNGAFSQGKPFPNYISATWCPSDRSWRVRYDVYYVHDGNMKAGHKHDWESATVMWKEDVKELNWWHRDALILSRHTGHRTKGWTNIQSINNDGDLRDDSGRGRRHPKVYVGIFKHPNFFDRKTNIIVPTGDNNEYRSDDWYYIPKGSDLLSMSESIIGTWQYGDATNPQSIGTKVCDWHGDVEP